MNNKVEFTKWLEKNTSLSLSTHKKYTGAISTISKELKRYGVIDCSLFNITSPTLIESLTMKYLEFPEFQAKDTRGNRMYSNALKYYQKFVYSKC